MKKEMLINVLQQEECRIAIVEDGVLEELYVERASQESYVGNIYKGKVVNIEPSIQAVFIDFGIGRNGFLHATDVDPIYYRHLLPKEVLAEMDEAEREDQEPRPAGNSHRQSSPQQRPVSPPASNPRVIVPESVSTVPPVPMALTTPIDIPPLGYVDDDDAEGFVSGLDELELPRKSPDSSSASEELEAEGFATDLNEPEEVIRENSWEMPPPLPVVEPRVDEDAPSRIMEEAPKQEFVPYQPTIPPAPSYIDEEELSGFGEGILEDWAAPTPKAAEAPAAESMTPETETIEAKDAEAPQLPKEEPETVIALESDESSDGEESNPDGDEAEDPEPKKPRAKTSRSKTGSKRTKSKSDPTADEDKPKAKPRRTKKKSEPDESSENADASDTDDDKPLPMESVERRTSESEEPEIRPFFDDDASANFDIDGPNDRFTKLEKKQTKSNNTDGELFSEEEEDDDSDAGSDAPLSEEDDGEIEDFTPPPERSGREREGRSGRGSRDSRGGGRGGRGGRDSRGGDRGPRGGNAGGSSQSKSHTRHKGLPIPPIQEIFKRGQEVIVQVIKEGIGTKGPTLSTFISIAGRYLVLMPSLNRVGVSKKIEDRDARHRLRDIMNRLNPPKGVGFIVRTAAVDRDEKELQNDLVYLLRLWQVVVRRIRRVAAPVEIYRESDMITRTIRDIFSNDIDTIWVDEEHAFAHASEFLQIVMPRFASRIRYHGDSEPLFHKYRIDEEISKINSKRLDLQGGGSIIIEQTEALVAIDVNSGNFRAENNAEETAFQMNLRAAKEIARQLRLRDLGGVIVNDFIDMRDERHRRDVENALRNALRRDRARTKVLRISDFGIIEMTRQRIQPSLKKRVFNECSHCTGTGYVKTHETMGIEVMRLLQLAAHRCPGGSTVTVTVHTDVANYVLNKKRKELAKLEDLSKMEVQVDGQPGVSPELCEFKCIDANGMEVRLTLLPVPTKYGKQPALPQRNFDNNGGRDNDRRYSE